MTPRTIGIEELHGRYLRPGSLVLDVRSPIEYRRGHVPGSANVPVRHIERQPARFLKPLAMFSQVYVHCSSGQRSQRAYEALACAGLTNLVHVSGAGMPEWVRRGYPVQREFSLARDLATGMVAGLVASLATAPVDKALKGLISDAQKRREHAVREGSPHEVGGVKIGERLTGSRLSGAQKRNAQLLFTAGYGILWGAIYALVRRRMPRATAAYGLPYAGAFFVACDGLLAPLLRMSPGLQRIPWQFDAKELGNHVVWTATAEAVHRSAERLR